MYSALIVWSITLKMCTLIIWRKLLMRNSRQPINNSRKVGHAVVLNLLDAKLRRPLTTRMFTPYFSMTMKTNLTCASTVLSSTKRKIKETMILKTVQLSKERMLTKTLSLSTLIFMHHLRNTTFCLHEVILIEEQFSA